MVSGPNQSEELSIIDSNDESISSQDASKPIIADCCITVVDCTIKVFQSFAAWIEN